MKLELQYINGKNGKAEMIQMPVADWEKVLRRIRKSDQVLQIKSDLTIALNQAEKLIKSKGKKQTLTAFLNGL